MPLLSPAFQRAIKVEMLSNALSKKILEMSARARAEEVQREATRKERQQEKHLTKSREFLIHCWQLDMYNKNPTLNSGRRCT